MVKLATLLLFSSLTLLASGGGEGVEKDIIERAFNFFVFAGILYYLIAKPIRNFLSDRTNSIENEFKRNEKRLEDSKAQLEQAQEELIEAKRKAGMIVTDAKREAQLSVEKIEASLQNDLATLEKQNSELQALEERKMVQNVVDEVLKEVMKSELGLDSESLSKTLQKKVS
jgi:F-type H+-transporting ATPase subunit b